MTGKQYGERIFEYLVQETKEKGQDFFCPEVLKQNPQACEFYEKQGIQFIKDTIFKTESQQSIILGMNISSYL